MKYKCLNPDCMPLDIVYSEDFIKGIYAANGKSAKLCSRCDVELSSIDTIDLNPKSPAINTKGCSGASKPFTH